MAILSQKARMGLFGSFSSQRPKPNGTKAPFGLVLLKFNSHHINVPLNAWSTKCRLIACMSVQIRSNLRDEFIKPN
jgi:hypothetical protein